MDIVTGVAVPFHECEIGRWDDPFGRGEALLCSS
jgi:hypothetical protein